MASRKSGRQPTGHVDPVETNNTAHPQKSKKKPPKPSQCRNYLRKAVADSMPTIMDKFVCEAAKGSVSHLNLLSKLAGFDQKPIPALSKRRGKSFVHRLLDNMKEHEAKMLAANEARRAAEREAGK